jgi:hypothetical protein
VALAGFSVTVPAIDPVVEGSSAIGAAVVDSWVTFEATGTAPTTAAALSSAVITTS